MNKINTSTSHRRVTKLYDVDKQKNLSCVINS